MFDGCGLEMMGCCCAWWLFGCDVWRPELAVLFISECTAVVPSSDAAGTLVLWREGLSVDTGVMSGYGLLWMEALSFHFAPDVQSHHH